MRIAEELKNDHHEIRQTFHHITLLVNSERQSRPGELRELYDKLRERIEKHLNAKEICLYRGLMDHDETRAIAQDFMDVHSEGRDALDDMVEFDSADDDCVKAFRDLRRRFTACFAEEENKVFSQLPMIFSEDQDFEMVELFHSLTLVPSAKPTNSGGNH